MIVTEKKLQTKLEFLIGYQYNSENFSFFIIKVEQFTTKTVLVENSQFSEKDKSCPWKSVVSVT